MYLCLCWSTHVQGGQRVLCRDWVFSSSSGSPRDGRDSSGEACQASFPPGPSHLSNFVLFNFKHLKNLSVFHGLTLHFKIFIYFQYFSVDSICPCTVLCRCIWHAVCSRPLLSLTPLPSLPQPLLPTSPVPHSCALLDFLTHCLNPHTVKPVVLVFL